MPIDPLAGSDVARVVLPEGVYGFGWAELRYLLGRHDTPASRASTTSLGFADAPTEAIAVSAGVSSLLARGLAEAVGDRAVSRGEAAMIETLLAKGVRWSGISLRVGDMADLMVLIEDGGALGLFQPRSLGTWFVGLTNETEQPSAPVLRALAAAFKIHGRVPFAIESRVLNTEPTGRFFRPEGKRWSVSSSPTAQRRAISHDELATEMAAILAPLKSQ